MSCIFYDRMRDICFVLLCTFSIPFRFLSLLHNSSFEAMLFVDCNRCEIKFILLCLIVSYLTQHMFTMQRK